MLFHCLFAFFLFFNYSLKFFKFASRTLKNFRFEFLLCGCIGKDESHHVKFFAFCSWGWSEFNDVDVELLCSCEFFGGNVYFIVVVSSDGVFAAGEDGIEFVFAGNEIECCGVSGKDE